MSKERKRYGTHRECTVHCVWATAHWPADMPADCPLWAMLRPHRPLPMGLGAYILTGWAAPHAIPELSHETFLSHDRLAFSPDRPLI